jgi:hypothetical protein
MRPPPADKQTKTPIATGRPAPRTRRKDGKPSWRSWIGVTMSLLFIAVVGVSISTVPVTKAVPTPSPSFQIPANVMQQLQLQQSLHASPAN